MFIVVWQNSGSFILFHENEWTPPMKPREENERQFTAANYSIIVLSSSTGIQNEECSKAICVGHCKEDKDSNKEEAVEHGPCH